MKPAHRAALRLMQVTDGRGDPGRIAALVAAGIEGGVRCVQVREPALGARELAALCLRLRSLLHAVDGLLLVNDRADVAAAGCCDGVHLGWRSLDAAAARRFLPDAVIGVAAHDPRELAAAHAAGADYATLSPIHATASKPGVEPLGPARASAWTAAVALPVVWLGGLGVAEIAAAAAGPAAGFAVLGALAGAPDEVRERAAALTAATRQVLR